MCLQFISVYNMSYSLIPDDSGVDKLALLPIQSSEVINLQAYTNLCHAALSLKAKQLYELNDSWHSVVRKLFNYNRWESEKSVLCNLGRLNVTHFIMIRKVNYFYHRIIIVCYICYIICLCHFCHVPMLICVRQFLPRNALQCICAVLGSHVVCLSVRLSVRPSVTLVICDRIGQKS